MFTNIPIRPTSTNHFMDRLKTRVKTVADAVLDAARISEDPKAKLAAEMHQYLIEKFNGIIERNKIAR